MSGQVVRDETGLHAVECECLECETGLGPTPMQRHYAREQLERKRAWEAMKKKPSAEEVRREEKHQRLAREAAARAAEEREWRRTHPPLTEEQIQNLNKLKAELFPTLAGGLKR